MSTDILEFVTYCIGGLAKELDLRPTEVYRRLKVSGILDEYIIAHYDVMHTYGYKYIMDDLTEFMRERGVLE